MWVIVLCIALVAVGLLALGPVALVAAVVGRTLAASRPRQLGSRDGTR